MSQNGLHDAHEVVRKASSVSTVPASATVTSDGTSGEGTSGEGTSAESTSGEDTFGDHGMRIGILGGTGPAGLGVAARFASVGVEVVVGSRNEDKAAAAVAELTKRWSGIDLAITPGTNREAAQADVVVVATPWEGALSTVKDLASELSGKIVVSMVNAMARWGDRFVPLVPPTGSVAVAIAGRAAPKPGGRRLPPPAGRAAGRPHSRAVGRRHGLFPMRVR